MGGFGIAIANAGRVEKGAMDATADQYKLNDMAATDKTLPARTAAQNASYGTQAAQADATTSLVPDATAVKRTQLQGEGLQAQGQVAAQPDLNNAAIVQAQIKKNQAVADSVLQPVQSATKQTEAETAQKGAAFGAQQQAGQQEMATTGLNMARDTVRLTQTAHMLQLIRLGDTDAAKDAWNNSPYGVDDKITNIGVGRVPMLDANGQPVKNAQGQPQMENAYKIEMSNGKSLVMPESHAKTFVDNYMGRVEKVGDDLVRIGADGKATPLYQQNTWQKGGEFGVFNKDTGESKGGAGNPVVTAHQRELVQQGVNQLGIAMGAKLDPISKMIDIDSIKDKTKFTEASKELEKRVLAGETPLAVADDLAKRYITSQKATEAQGPSGSGAARGASVVDDILGTKR